METIQFDYHNLAEFPTHFEPKAIIFCNEARLASEKDTFDDRFPLRFYALKFSF